MYHGRMRIILASESPRRKELLASLDVAFEIVPSMFDEHLDQSRPIDEVAKELALGKAREVAARFPDACVIGADTIVGLNGKQLGKPKDAEDARRILHALNGHASSVTTGVAVICRAKGVETASADTSLVHFKRNADQAIETYLATGDSLDKAGAYGIQSGAGPLIDHIEGDYSTIVGLPLRLSKDMLEQALGLSIGYRITKEVKKLGLPQGSFVIVGSALLEVLGLRTATDIDMAVPEEVYRQLQRAGWREEPGATAKPVLRKGVYDVGIGFGDWSTEDLLQDAYILDGVPFISLAKLAAWKSQTNRSHDQSDLEIIRLVS